MAPRQRFLFWLALCVLLAIAYQPQKRIDLNLIAGKNQKFLAGFFVSQENTCWTEAKAAVWMTGLGRANLPWHIGLRLSGARPNGFNNLAHVRIKINGAPLA